MRKATIKEVAAEAGVSTATVSRVLNESGFVSDEIKERIHRAVEKLNYRPNAVARSLKQDKSYTIGIVVPDITNPFFSKLSRGIEDAVAGHGYQLIFCSTDEDAEKERRLGRMLSEKRVDALVLASSDDRPDMAESLEKAGTPVILVDRRFEPPSNRLDLIAEDNRLGAYSLAKALLQKGHRRIGVINGSLTASTGRDRFDGYESAMREHGIQPDDRLVFEGRFTEEGGIEAVRYFMDLPDKPTAMLSFNNQMTFGVLLELTRRGCRVPGDFAVASYGWVEAALLLNRPGLLYVEQAPYDMGKKAGERLLQRLGGGKDSMQEPLTEIFEPKICEI
ncbi:LacI family DNA-binding transcriptional regulator [Paenibacillus hamazuiensis]|uniref:LacI family DNA-binding transcriptional regulator n=1 Tax=Paenibacillus hamazuiensis TaxID=2936508 RepID=UPI00200CC439|nr:LacI family DNA-binding transcriptional regulator [Paenibacillus hamazuiensis]